MNDCETRFWHERDRWKFKWEPEEWENMDENEWKNERNKSENVRINERETTDTKMTEMVTNWKN